AKFPAMSNLGCRLKFGKVAGAIYVNPPPTNRILIGINHGVSLLINRPVFGSDLRVFLGLLLLFLSRKIGLLALLRLLNLFQLIRGKSRYTPFLVCVPKWRKQVI